MSKSAIGLFDSGLGGTSIWNELHKLLPFENTIYLADSKNAPYGPKGQDAIIELSIKNTELLLEKNCKLIIVACNTATTNAIQYLRDTYSVPFIGIEPAIKPAALNTKNKAIGILATKGTLSSALFHQTTDLYTQDITVIEQEGEGIVQLIENGQIHSSEMKALLQLYMEPMIKNNIDYLVLGCTHYPYLVPLLLELLPKHVKIIDSSEAVALQTQYVLEQQRLLNTDKLGTNHEFFTNGDPKIMKAFIGKGNLAAYLDF